MKINFLDINKNYLGIEEKVKQEYKSLFENCDFICENKVKIFENNISKYLGINHFIGCANKTNALEIVVKSLELDKDDEIIIQSNIDVTTCFSLINKNIKLTLCDIDHNTHIISIDSLKQKITSKTKALIISHLYNMQTNMNEIMKMCNEQNIILIENYAQTYRPLHDDDKTSEYGKISCFSFCSGKKLDECEYNYYCECGIGTNDNVLNEKIRKIVNLDCNVKYYRELSSKNTKLDTLQSDFLNIKFKNLDLSNKSRLANALIYNENFKNIPEIIVPKVIDEYVLIYHFYVIKTNKRNELKKYLDDKGINCLIQCPISIAKTDIFEDNNFNDILNSKQILFLPLYPNLTKEEIEYICSNIKNFFLKLNKLKSIKTVGKPGTLHCLNEMDFNTKRFFYLDDFNELDDFKNDCLKLDNSTIDKKRGLHANINFNELMIVLEGEIEIKLIDKNQIEITKKLSKDEYIYIPKMNWVEFEILFANTIIIVLVDEIMEKSRSIHNFNEFLNY